jgi:hypothetical protein
VNYRRSPVALFQSSGRPTKCRLRKSTRLTDGVRYASYGYFLNAGSTKLLRFYAGFRLRLGAWRRDHSTGPLSRETGKRRSQVELAGGAFADQAGALDVAAHGAQVTMGVWRMMSAHAFVVGYGDERSSDLIARKGPEDGKDSNHYRHRCQQGMARRWPLAGGHRHPAYRPQRVDAFDTLATWLRDNGVRRVGLENSTFPSITNSRTPKPCRLGMQHATRSSRPLALCSLHPAALRSRPVSGPPSGKDHWGSRAGKGPHIAA